MFYINQKGLQISRTSTIIGPNRTKTKISTCLNYGHINRMASKFNKTRIFNVHTLSIPASSDTSRFPSKLQFVDQVLLGLIAKL